MNILLTGGMGFIGSHTAIALIEAGYDLVLFDNLSNSSISVLDNLKTINKIGNITFIEGDICDTELLSKTLNHYAIDAVIHFAGLKSVADSVKDPISYFDVNVKGSISLIDAMKKNKIKKIIFSSSATVYGNPKYLPIDEIHPTNPINPYGRTKLFVENMLKDICESDSSWSAICLRYFNPVGAHYSGLIGENSLGTPNNLMPIIANVASGISAKVLIYGNDYDTVDGTGIRDYIHVMDLANGHLKALNFLKEFSGWDVINLGTGYGLSVLELIKKYSLVIGKDIYFEYTDRRPGDIASSFACAKKAKVFLDWETKESAESMCASSWLWQKRSLK